MGDKTHVVTLSSKDFVFSATPYTGPFKHSLYGEADFKDFTGVLVSVPQLQVPVIAPGDFQEVLVKGYKCLVMKNFTGTYTQPSGGEMKARNLTVAIADMDTPLATALMSLNPTMVANVTTTTDVVKETGPFSNKDGTINPGKIIGYTIILLFVFLLAFLFVRRLYRRVYGA